jgi:cell division protease FtsH
MHAMAAALLERETLDAAEIELLIQGKELGPVKSSLAYADGDGDTQKVLKPDTGRKPGFGEGQATTA